jgi:hypothetical protein
MEHNSDILMLSLPKSWKEDEVKQFISEKMGKPIEEVIPSNVTITLRPDSRPEAVNSGG